jgi:urea transport system substrate-binding protein
MASSETPVMEATVFAVDEINKNGGVLGRQIEAVIRDSRSDPAYAAQAARDLLEVEKVAAIFGCWTSACRKAVMPIVEEDGGLLFYPVQFEGMEDSPRIIYMGLTPNQQILPAVQWAYQNLGSRMFLVGSDYVFPRAAGEVVKDFVPLLGAEIVGDEYLLLGQRNTMNVVQRIVETEPDVILNTINGDTNEAFFRELRAAGIRPNDIPTISFSVAEVEIQGMESTMVGDYAAWSYFQSITGGPNRRFVASFKDRFGAERVVDDPMEAAYSGVHLWARAVELGGAWDPAVVARELSGKKWLAPQGFVSMDEDRLFMWKYVRIGQIQDDGQFEIVWESSVALRPEPFPRSRPRQAWERYLATLYKSWGNDWANPGDVR